MKLDGMIEGILFAMGSSVSKKELAEALDAEEKEIEEAADALEARLASEESGITLLRLDDRLQLGSRKECYDALIRLASHARKPVLTNAVRETLAIIAYKQPVTKAEIAKIRGVNSDHAVNRLVEYGLVAEAGRLEAPGRPILFGTSEEFLRHFALSSTDDLPDISAEKLAEFAEEAEQESTEVEV
ncbi:MAG: SMC-Scp complex subunit ScpB [Lachnospiraceae bacterium]|nr:SMC-Scp complex subunit ScpB [Lachnospiraceae bacterium]MBR3165894.1 SMC-Scp complex subunit ScpB [Lachnospiraceae bacterium]